MASILRYAVASPKKQYFTGTCTLDLAYITPNLIVCSMPTSSCIKGWYRMWLDDLTNFLTEKHGDHWRFFNFQAERSGYGDEEVYGKVSHFPFPDHNPPPFEMIPHFLLELKKFLCQNSLNVAVLHCKAGKGRSGTMACAYLMSNFKYSFDKATNIFTECRMRAAFGEGISISSQRRYLRYVEDWVHVLKQQYYHPIKVKIKSIRIWNPYYPEIDISINTYSEGGKHIKQIYTFTEHDTTKRLPEYVVLTPNIDSCLQEESFDSKIITDKNFDNNLLIVPADIQLVFQHKYMVGGTFPVLHSTAYTWFNAFFETYGNSEGFDFSRKDGSISLLWADLDGFKGTKKRGSPLFERVDIFWKVFEDICL